MSALNWKIAGAAGEGIKVAGLILSKTAFRQGFYLNGYTEYPSLIRGGHNTFQTLISSEENAALAPAISLDVLVTLNANGLLEHQMELNDQTVILANTRLIEKELADFPAKNQVLHLPYHELADESGGGALVRNIVSLGASCFFLGLKLSLLNQVIEETFGRKGEAVVTQNQKAAQLGFDYAQKNYFGKKMVALPQTQKEKSLFLTGNEALSLGAIAGGMKFFSAYPMTPTSSILHYLSQKEKQFKLVVRHAEDEIGVINSAIGAAYSGVRAMVATAGGGFSLMVEGLGLAGVSETAIVVVLGQRPGPATGMPTWTSQGDLLFAINASQDEFPRIVITPGDMTEAFASGYWAQNWAEKYQLPVIIITDKYLAESYFTTKEFTKTHQNNRYGFTDTSKRDNLEPYARYQNTDSGVSPRPLPGQRGGVHLTNSYEHDELGYATEIAKERKLQVDKRFKKFAAIMADPDRFHPILYGPKEAKNTLVSWGSNKTIILKALASLPNTNFIHLPWVWPFPAKELLTLMAKSKRLITVEGNRMGQLNRLIRQETGLIIKDQLLKYDGRPFYAEEIINKLKESHGAN
jgi:2-oxoglutarate ferredoxin oxidoreductase subunit alpha